MNPSCSTQHKTHQSALRLAPGIIAFCWVLHEGFMAYEMRGD